MKTSIILTAAVMAFALSACDKQPATVVTPAVVTVPTPVPGPSGPPGPTGATGSTGTMGEPGKPGGDTVIVVPAPEAPPAR